MSRTNSRAASSIGRMATFNIAIKETYANGHVSKHEVLEEFLGRIIAVKEAQRTANEASFREYYGDGVLHPGAVWDEPVPVQPGLTDYQAVVDVVTYMDGTAESANDDALGRIIEERQATVDSNKIATEIKSPLADANDTPAAMTAARKIQDRAIVWKAQQHTKLAPPHPRWEPYPSKRLYGSVRGRSANDRPYRVLDQCGSGIGWPLRPSFGVASEECPEPKELQSPLES